MKTQGLATAAIILLTSIAASAKVAHAEGVQWLTDAPTALQQSRATGRPVLMRFSAEWCGPCRKMERTTFADPGTVETIHQSFIPLVIDADENEAIAQKLQIKGLPTLLVVTPDMTILTRIKGFQTSERLMPQLNEVLVQYQKSSGVPALPVAQQRPAGLPQDTNPFMANSGGAAARMPVAPHPSTGSAVVRRNTNHREQLQTGPSFGGYCLTSVVEERKLIKGTPEYESTYRGQTLYFHDDDQRDLFFETPEKYWPALDGQCPLTMVEAGQSVPGKLQYAAVFRNQIWLMSDREKMEKFIGAPADFVDQLQDRQRTAAAPGQSF
jgi:thiol-disulfide isomerase/thioredoxin